MKLAAVQARLDRLSYAARVGLVAGGYLAALVAATLALLAYVQVTNGPDRDASSGMYAFADALLFLLVWAAGSVAPTTLMLYFLRRSIVPWRVFGSLGLAASVTGLLAVLHIAQTHAEVGAWSMLAVPRVLLAPLLLGLFVLVGVFSPGRGSRTSLFAAAAIECVTSFYGFVHWFVPALLH